MFLLTTLISRLLLFFFFWRSFCKRYLRGELFFSWQCWGLLRRHKKLQYFMDTTLMQFGSGTFYVKREKNWADFSWADWKTFLIGGLDRTAFLRRWKKMKICWMQNFNVIQTFPDINSSKRKRFLLKKNFSSLLF